MSSVREEQLVCDNSDSQGEEDFAIRFKINDDDHDDDVDEEDEW